MIKSGPDGLGSSYSEGNPVSGGNSSEGYMQTDSSLVFATYCFIGTFGILLNILVIVGILTNKRMRNVPNMFILNLGVSDLLFSLGVPLIYHSTTAPKWQLGIFLCKMVNGKPIIKCRRTELNSILKPLTLSFIRD